MSEWIGNSHYEAYVNGVFDYYVMNYYNYAMSKFKEYSNRYTPVLR